MLWDLSQKGSLLHKIKSAGGVERVQHAIAAEDATGLTKEYRAKLLNKLLE